MHAYKLFCSCVHKLKKDPSWLLNNLHCHQFASALSSIYDILQNWEEGSPNFNPALRYARLGPEFFSNLQTKSFADLVYCLACIMENFVQSIDNDQPTNIVQCERSWFRHKTLRV
ncbi:unnamed protein product [Lactuca saligna]|uniref:Uncharacterized protein n=1 Tax=Lactuca saligna TaxID=75948 RepID=A0AA35VAV5_LACSI|nr:unnamed protein product [Lactuca saligna]